MLYAAVGREGAPQVIVADFHLDEGDGLQAIAAVSALIGPTPSVLLTADRSPAVREAAGAQGAHVLKKPVKPAALRALLAQWRAVRIAADVYRGILARIEAMDYDVFARRAVVPRATKWWITARAVAWAR